ncbi:hypothetical protein BDR05DRAFT_877147, partial [Suillus weaverae]
ASSIPCEQLFSAGGETATDRRSRLGAERFEQIQVLKSLWRGSVADYAADNSAVVEDVILEDFEELLQLDGEVSDWECDKDELVIA